MKKLQLLLLLLLALPIGMLAQGSSWQTATLINQGGSGSGSLDKNNSDDWFKIVVPEEGKVTISLTLSSDLSIKWLDYLWVKNNSAYSRTTKWYMKNGESLVVDDAGAGTYYLHIQRDGGAGSYSLNYQFSACPYANDVEPNDENGQGTEIAVGQTIQGRIGYLDANDYRDNYDSYKITVPQDGRVQLIVNCEKTYNLQMKWLDVNRKQGESYYSRATKWYMVDDTLTIDDAGVGTYYLRLNRDKGHGGYSLRYIFTPNNYANDAEPNDENGQGTEIAIGETVQGHIGYLDANDYRDNYDSYKINVPQDGRVQLIVNCEKTYDLQMKWLDVNRKQDESYYNRATKWYMVDDTLTIDDAGVGTYYLRLNRDKGFGGYKLKYVFTPNRYANDAEPNDENGQGTEIINGQTVQGHIGYLDAKDYRDNYDSYKINVPQDGRVQLIVNCEKTYELQMKWLEVYRKQNENYYNRATKWYMVNDTLTIEDAGIGTYYLRINRDKGFGGYTLKYIFTPYNFPNDTEPNEEWAQATDVMENNSTFSGHLGYLDANDKRDNEDWIKLDTNNTLLLNITVAPDTTSTLKIKWMDIVKVKGDRTEVVANKWYINEPHTFDVDNIEEDANYYVHISRDGGHGGYTLTYGTLERAMDSKIRVHYIGQKSTRLGIPSPFQIKVENLDSRPTGSFFLVVPVSDDVKLLYAECPCDTGIVRYNIEDMSDEAQNCAALMVSNLDPFESYTLTMYAEGRVDGKTARPKTNRIAISGTFIAVGAFVGSVVVGLVVDRGIRYYQDKYHNYVVSQGLEDKYMRSLSLTKDQLLDQKEEYNLPVECVKGVVKKVGENVMKTVPGGSALATTMGQVENVRGVSSDARRHVMALNSYQSNLDDFMEREFGGRGEYADIKVGATKKVSSWDPNEMCGPVGYGDEGYISETKTINYQILFENKKEATAPAYRIRISDVLDENVFDVNTVRFGSTSHEGIQYNWKMSREGNKLSWDIEGIELPPNVNAPEGEGYVTFSVDLKPGLPTGTQIKNKATIIFDYNAPIETNEYVNTLDLVPPTGRVQAVSSNNNEITVNCSGEDSESGISYYKYYYSVGGGDFQLLAENSLPEITFPIEEGRNANDYTFCVVAVDNVGNTQLTLSEPYSIGTSVNDKNMGPSNDSWTITRLDGKIVASGKGTPSARLTSGVYIIRQGNTSRKVIIK